MLPIDQFSPRLLRALAEYHPSRAMAAVTAAGESPTLDPRAMVHLAQWIHDGAEVVEIGPEAAWLLSTIAPRIDRAVALERRTTAIVMSGQAPGMVLVRPVGDALELGSWSLPRGATRWHFSTIERLTPLDVVLGRHSVVRTTAGLAAVTSGLVASRETALLPAQPPRPKRPGRRHGHVADGPRARRLLLDPTALLSWMRAPTPRAPAEVPRASATPRDPRGIHQVAEHTRGVWVSDPQAGEEVLDLREGRHGLLCLVRRSVSMHVRGDHRLVTRRSRLSARPADLR